MLLRWVEADWNDGGILESEEGKANSGRKPSGVSTVLGQSFCFGALCCSFEEWVGCVRSLQGNVQTRHLSQFRPKSRVTNMCWMHTDFFPSLRCSPACRSYFITDIQSVGVSSCRFPLCARDQILCPLDFLRFCRQWRRADGSCTG